MANRLEAIASSLEAIAVKNLMLLAIGGKVLFDSHPERKTCAGSLLLCFDSRHVSCATFLCA